MQEITNVSIKQLTIEVKVVKIDNRQMTLAVFRQLPEEHVIDLITGELNGIPWGKVNYCPLGNCGNKYDPEHLHIVWQRENKLFRSKVYHDWWDFDWLRHIEFLTQTQINEATEEQIGGRTRKYPQSYTLLEQLDQLFIAV